MRIIIALILFSLIILFHELGHFLLAKLNGIVVVEFSLGMGPRLISKELGGTRYSLKALPLGGSCMMKGEDLADTSEGSFGSKSALSRISVIAAGPIFNFLMAFLASVILTAMIGYDPAVIYSVMDGYPAQEAGLQGGDTVISMNGKKIYLSREINNYLSFHQGEVIDLVVKRDGQKKEMRIRPKYDEEEGRYLIGISTRREFKKTNFFETLKYGWAELRFWIDLTIQSLRMLFTGQVGVQEMSGPVGVVDMIGESYEHAVQYGWFDVLVNMLNIAILLSANLGVMNLLPIPALDGGRLLFLVIELIRGKRIDAKAEGMVHFIGFAILMVLMIFILFQDVGRLI